MIIEVHIEEGTTVKDLLDVVKEEAKKQQS
jgi:hypothetical protein